MRVLSYNVRGGVGLDGASNLETILAILREADADVVALQEVLDDLDARRSLLRGLARLDYPRVIHGPTMRKARGAYGNVLLTRLELVERELIDLSVPRREPRGAILARVETAAGGAEIVATHLGLRAGERRAQARRLAARLGPREGGASPPLRIALGDFNEWFPGGRPLRALARALGPPRGRRTYHSRWPVVALDRVFVHPAEALVRLETIRDARTRVASDHLPLLAEIGV